MLLVLLVVHFFSFGGASTVLLRFISLPFGVLLVLLVVHFSSFGGASGGVSGSIYPEDTTLPMVSTWNPISCR